MPNDTMPPFYPSGIRLGTPAITTKGMKEEEMVKIAAWINMVMEEVSDQELPSDKEARKEFFKAFRLKVVKNKKLLGIAKEIKKLCSKFP